MQHAAAAAAAVRSPNGNSSANFYCSATGVYASTYPPVPLPDDTSLSLVPHLFARFPRTRPGAPVLLDAATSEAISRADLRRLVFSLAAGLIYRLGLRAGDIVLLVLPNSIAFPVAFLAVLASGGVATTMSPSSAPAEFAARVQETSPAIVLATPGDAEMIPRSGVPVVLVPESFDLGDGGVPKFAQFYALLDSGVVTPPSVGQDDAAAILYSSGTGGRSKGVVLTHRNLIATVELFVRFEASQYAQAACDNVYLATLPMFHVYGLSLFAVGLLSLGSTVVVMKRFDAAEAIKAINRYKVTHFPLVPPIMAALVAAARPAALPLDSLVQVSSGAAPPSNKLIQDFMKVFPHVDFIQGYGMTESAAVGTRGFNTPKQRKYASVGLLAPNMHARIVDRRTGCSLPPGSCGELWLRGPAIMKGYLNTKDACLSIDGWLQTGDNAYFDSEGYLYIVGRLKDMIKYKGFQIAPADLEAVLIKHPEILDVAVTSADDEEAGEIPVAFVVRKAGSLLSCTQVMEHVANKVSSYKKVRKVVFVESIPKSAAGKVLRRLLKESLRDDVASTSSNSSARSRL